MPTPQETIRAIRDTLVSGNEQEALDVLEGYAKERSIGFIEYQDKFRREEGRMMQREYKKAGGIFTWRGKDDKDIYDDYIDKKPIESYLAPEGIKSCWLYNEYGKLVHSSEK